MNEHQVPAWEREILIAPDERIDTVNENVRLIQSKTA